MGDQLLVRDLYNNPTELSAVMLNLVSNKLLNGRAIEDPNSPFLLSIEMTASISAGIIEQNTNQFAALYPRRAQTFEDLYKTISDYEFLDIYASPATTTMSLILEKNQLMDRAPIVAGDYHLIMIPKDSVIKFGDYKFGLYYPIKIMIAKNTKLVYITYDDSEINPLCPINDLNVTFTEYKYMLADIIELSLPIYQFETTKIVEDCSKVSGFNKKLTFNNKFYAARVFSYKDDAWKELKISYSETTYDPDDPTMVLKVYSDTNLADVYIPQIYFDKDLIGTKIKIEVLTTLGAIDIDISNLDFTRIEFSIPSQSDNPNKIYSDAMNKLETCHVLPSYPIISGGTNAATFEQVKSMIQNRISSNSLLASPGQLKNYYQSLGFTIDRVKDTLEDRIYCACGLLTDSQGIPIQASMDTTEIPMNIPSHMSAHLVNDTNAITVLPTATFRYDTALKRFILLNQEEQNLMTTLLNTDKSAFCLFVNNNTFSRPMYHTHLKTNGRTPFITNYDLSNPTVNKIRFIRENINTSERLVVTAGKLLHNGYEEATTQEPHKYRLELTTAGTDGLGELLKNSTENVKLVMTVETSNVQLIQIADYDKITGIFSFEWTPNYKFDYYGQLGVNVLNQDPTMTTGNFTNAYSSEVFLPLDFTAKLLVFAYLPDVTDTYLDPNLVGILPVKYKQVGYQEIELSMGKNLHNKLYSSVNLAYQQSEIVDSNYVYPEDVYLTYGEDVYDRDVDNSLKLILGKVNNGQVVIKKPTITIVSSSASPEFKISAFEALTDVETNDIDIIKKHAKGDLVLVNNQPVLLHKAGDIKVDGSGNPLIHPREIVFMGQMLHMRLNLFYSELSLTEAIQNITRRTESQYNKIDASSSRLLENTYVLYRPFSCMGNGVFLTDSKKTITHPLDISLRFKYYVPEYVLNNTDIQKQIRNRTIAITEALLLTGKLSVTEIASKLRDEFSSIIRHVDIFGINENIDLQMIENTDKTKQPILKQELWLDENGFFILIKSIITQFIA